jgi:hypothetical protein
VTLQTVSYLIVDASGQVVRTGVIDVTNSTKVSAVVAGVPSGSGYTVQLAATSTDGTAHCTGKSAPFDVSANATTSVTVLLECRIGVDAGTVIINGGTNVCPQITSGTVSPADVTVGHSIALSALGSDPNGDALTYVWSASGPGTVSNGASGSGTFTCTGSGAATVTVVVSDGDTNCDATASYPVTCDAPDAGTLTQGVTLATGAQAADTATMAALVDYNSDSGLLTFSAATPQLASLKAGDVLLSGAPTSATTADQSSPAPQGFMRKVTSVTTVGSQVQVATTQATLADAVASAFVDTTHHYPDATGAVFTPTTTGVALTQVDGGSLSLAASPGLRRSAPLPPGPSTPIGSPPAGGITLSFNNVVLSGNASAQATLNGWVNLDPTAFVHLDIEGCGFLCTYVREFDAGVTLNQSSDIQASLNASGAVQFEQTVGTIGLPGFATGVLYWQPTFDVTVGINVSGQISVTLHAADQVSLEGGARWNDDHMGNQGWTNLSQVSANATFDVPYLVANVKAQTYVRSDFGLLLFGVVGPEVSTQLGLDFDIGTPRRPYLDLSLDFTQSVGVRVSAFGFFNIDYDSNLPLRNLPLGQSPNIPPFISSISPPAGTSASLGGLVFSVNAYDLQDGTNLTYTWTDETGTVLGTGNPLIAPPALTVGPHDITVTVTDAVGGHSSATILGVLVNPPPLAVTASLPPISQPGQAQNHVSSLDTNSCLPSPAFDIVGTAQGGTQPYSYSWTLTLLGENDDPVGVPITLSTNSPTLSTTALPSNWPTWLQAAGAGSGIVQITFTVGDATGGTSSATQTVNWLCDVVCGQSGEPCCIPLDSPTPCASGDYCNTSNTCAVCPTSSPLLVESRASAVYHPDCGSAHSFSETIGGACTPGFHFSAAKTTTVENSTYSNSSCSFQWNGNGPLDCSVTVTYVAAQFCDFTQSLQCTTTVYEVPDEPAGCPAD